MRAAAHKVRSYLRWRSTLRSASFEPDPAGRLAPIGDRDVIVAGCPRSGTSLLAGLLFQPPGVVSCMEPWDGLRLPPDQLFRSIRREISETGTLRRGRLDVEALEQQKRVAWHRDGERTYEVQAEPDHVLAVKWPAFWRYLDFLPAARFLICVRHPAEVIASFLRTGGRLATGQDYDVPFNRAMNQYLAEATDDVVERCALMYEYINSRVLPHLDRPEVLVIHHERWFSDPSALLEEVSGFLGLRRGLELNVEIRPTEPVVDEDIRAAARTFCPSGRALGYD